MQLRTTFECPLLPEPIGLNSHVLMLGSCFTEHIGDRLQSHKFRTVINPSGILFHPLAIANTLERGLAMDVPGTDTFFPSAGTYRHFDFHSDLSHPELPMAVEQVRHAVMQLHDALQTTTHIMISFGTSLVYEDVRTGAPVANNHKLHADRFRKRQLSVEEIVQTWMQVMDRVEQKRKMQWVITISPVRHIKDGVVQNMRSKSVLIEAVHKLRELRDHVSYFPAYELMMDDLRDYRFYADDMIHPSDTAIRYIWEQFCAASVTNEAQIWIEKWAPVLQAMQHRPFFPDSAEHQVFRKSRLQMLQELQRTYPMVDMRAELDHFS